MFGFTSTESYLRVARQHTKQISVTFEFRTIAKQVLLLYHQLMPSGHLTVSCIFHNLHADYVRLKNSKNPVYNHLESPCFDLVCAFLCLSIMKSLTSPITFNRLSLKLV